MQTDVSVMQAPQSITLPLALTGILVVSGFAVVIALLLWLGNLISRKLTGWPDIVARFPMTNAHDLGESYKAERGRIRNVSCGFLIRAGPAGVCLFPTFARRDPCCVPWAALRQASINRYAIHFDVEWERGFSFCLPPSALPIVKANLPPGLLRQAPEPSLSGAMAALKDFLR